MTDGASSFDEYWVLFVRACVDPIVRRVLVLSTGAALGSLAVGVATRRTLFLLLSPALGFAPVWALERLRGEPSQPPGPPLFFALARLKLLRLVVLGRMDAEMERVLRRSAEESSEEHAVPRTNMVTDHTLH